MTGKIGMLFTAAVLLAGGCATNSLERSLPGEEGVDPAAVQAFVESLERKMMQSGDTLNGDPTAFMLLKNGKVIAEGAWAPCRLDAPRHVFSMSKSFTSTAVGFAVQEKRLTLEDPVISFFPDKLPLQISGHLAAMRVRDLLTMQSGHKSDPIGKMFEAKDLVRGFLGSEIEFKPGTHFVYNNGATYMLSAIITKVTGESLRDYLTPRLFEPLGIENVKWEADDRGVNFGAWGLHLTPEDAAKFAQFCLNKGRWNGKQLLSEGWINLATAPQCNVVAGDDRSDWNQGYGFQFWRCRNGAFRADGFLGQYAVVMEDEDAVLIMFNSSNRLQPALDTVWETLLPALRGEPVRPERKTTDASLRTFLAGLTLSFPEKTVEPKLFRPGGKVSVSLPDDNPFHAEELLLEHDGKQLRATLNGYPMNFGIGSWAENPAVPGAADGERSYPIEGPLFGRAFQQGADEWLLVTVSPNSAIQNFFRFRFDGGTVALEGRFNFDETPVETTGKID